MVGFIRSPLDMAAGTLISAVALTGLWLSRDWRAGTLAAMEEGFFPRFICILLLAMGAIVIAGALRRDGPALPGWAWRPAAAVTTAVLAFAFALDHLGLVLTILAMVAIATFAGHPLRPAAFLALWAALATLCVAIFSWGLGLPLRAWP